MNIFRFEFRHLQKTNLIWTIALIIVMGLFMFLFTTLQADFTAFFDMMDGLPAFLQDALSLHTLNIGTILGFYGFSLFYILLFAAIQAMNYGMSTVSIELSQNTADFLFTKPVTRTKILRAKLAAIVVSLLITNILYTCATILALNLVKTAEFSLTALFLIQLSILLFQLLFVAIGIFVAVFLKRIKSVLPITLGFVFGFFIIDMLNQSLADIKLSFLSPFAYFKPSFIIENLSFDLPYFLLTIGLIFVLTTVTFIVYHRKDLPSI